MYAACLRNYVALVAHLIENHPLVAVIGAGSRGEFRLEDQLCCAWIAELLVNAGYEPQDSRTISIIEQWSGAPVEVITESPSADYLRKSGQSRDIDFVLNHVNDLNDIYRYERGQVLKHAAELLLL